MAGFEKTKLATGEFRGDYIVRRLGEGATVKAIHAEINEPELYSGPLGKKWPESVVYAAKSKLEGKASPKVAVKRVDAVTAAPVEVLNTEGVIVPPEYEGILDVEDVADVREEAAKALRAEQRKQARADLLKQATADLRREQALEAQRGTAKGDNVDVVIDLAPYAEAITLDGKSYRHGTSHRVPRKVFNVLMEQMQRSWQHEGSIHGAADRPYRKSLEQRGLTANNFAAGVRA